MQKNRTRLCLSCQQELSESAFDYRYVKRYAHGKPTRNGLHLRCRECRAAIDERMSRPEYIIDESSGCWNWNRSVSSNGYGMVQRTEGGRAMVAHRYIYIRERGPIPDGLQLDHLCRNKRCVNPDHLEPVTQATNTQRGAKTAITPKQAMAIYRLRGKERREEVAKRYKVSVTTVASIWVGLRWANITGHQR